MSKRIGKYKVSKKDSELSIADGGTVSGALTLAHATLLATAIPALSESNVTTTGQIFSTGSDFFTSGGGKGTSVQGGAATGSGVVQLLCIRKQ
jgi:hypothetical protein